MLHKLIIQIGAFSPQEIVSAINKLQPDYIYIRDLSKQFHKVCETFSNTV